ncbi:MAG TPA: Ig-like domain-containing protein [Thermoanaerobaculia bacterium]
MSYLNTLRLHFAGRFQANISTVNNDPVHFYNDAFRPSWQELQGPDFDPPNGWFSPGGDAAWRLLGCKVTAAWLPAGEVALSEVPASDLVLQCIVADSDRQAPAKLVDLDPEQQLVSEIWGLQVRIADADGNTLLLSDFEHAAFMDIWDRAQGQTQAGDADAGAMYQSVLRNLQWGDVSGSPFLTKLREAATDGLLSIKFNVDNINMDNTSPDFLTGRIAGTIGPAAVSEPQHMVLGRHFLAATYGGGGFFVPAGGINNCVAVVDPDASCIFLDLGNALPTIGTTGAPVDLGELTLGVFNVTDGTPFAGGAVTALGTISGYASNEWYTKTAGVVALPLTSEQLQSIAAAPLVLRSANAAFIDEWPTGVFVTADTFVYRMSPGDSVNVNFYLTQWGQPVSGATVFFTADPSQLQAQAGSPLPQFTAPAVAVPEDAIQFNGSATTDANGIAVLTVTATDPGTPRNFNDGKDYGIDGQVYGIRPSVNPQVYGGGPVDPWNFVSILLWSGFTAADPVTWNDIAPTMTQYANLYPVMNRFLNLGDYDSVVAHTRLLTLAFSLDIANPNSMPVTRDLSPAKRQAILSFLANPQRGEVAKVRAMAAPEVPAEAVTPPPLARKGGKAAAAARRLVNLSARKGSQS